MLKKFSKPIKRLFPQGLSKNQIYLVCPMKYLDPKKDLTFKKIFGEHEDLVISFLNALLPLQEGRFIESISYITPEQVPTSANL